MNSSYSWKKEYEEKGFSIFDKQTSNMLHLIEQKYGIDYKAFLYQLQVNHADLVRKTQLAKVVERLKKSVLTISSRVSTLHNNTAEPKDIDELFGLMAQADDDLKYLVGMAEKSDAFKERLNEAQQLTGINLKNIQSGHSVVKGRMENLYKMKSIGDKAVSAVGASGKGDFALGLLGLAGPLAPLAAIALTASRGIREASIAKRDRITAETLTLRDDMGAAGVESNYQKLHEVPPNLRDVWGGEHGREGGAYARGSAGRRNSAYSSGGDRDRARSDGQYQGTSMGSSAVSGDLFFFFNKQADKALWTSEVLKELKRISGNKGGGAGIGSIPIPIPGVPVIPVAWGALGIALAAVVAAAAAVAAHAVVVSDFFKKMAGATDKKPFIKAAGNPSAAAYFLGSGSDPMGIMAREANQAISEATYSGERAIPLAEKEKYGLGATDKAVNKVRRMNQLWDDPTHAAMRDIEKSVEQARIQANEDKYTKGIYPELEKAISENKVGLKEFNTSLVDRYIADSEKTRGILSKMLEKISEKPKTSSSSGGVAQKPRRDIGNGATDLVNAGLGGL